MDNPRRDLSESQPGPAGALILRKWCKDQAGADWATAGADNAGAAPLRPPLLCRHLPLLACAGQHGCRASPHSSHRAAQTSPLGGCGRCVEVQQLCSADDGSDCAVPKLVAMIASTCDPCGPTDLSLSQVRAVVTGGSSRLPPWQLRCDPKGTSCPRRAPSTHVLPHTPSWSPLAPD